MKKNFLTVFKHSMLIVGTVVGAGFASGQEIVVFFAQYGFISLLFVIPVFIFLFLGVKEFLSFGNKNYCIDFKNKSVFKIFEGLSFIIFIIVASTMLAAVNELLSQIFFDFGFPFWSLIVILISTFVVNFGINGLLKTSFWIIPLIIAGIIYVGIKGAVVSPLSTPAFSTDLLSIVMLTFSSISYSCFNLVTANKVLFRCGNNLSKKQIKQISIVVASIIAFLIAFIIILLLINNEVILFAELPLVEVSFLIGNFTGFSFSFILFLSIITTIFSTQFSSIEFVSKFFKNKKGRKFLPSIISGLLILIVSVFGFGKIVKFAYPIVGAVGFVMLFYIRKLSLEMGFNSANDKIHSAR